MAIPMSETPLTSVDIATAGPLMRRATNLAIAVALILIVIKFAAGLYTGSVALLSSLVDSVLDLGASVINAIAVRHALRPADMHHRFGHGKAEGIAGLAQGAIIFGSAAFIIFQSAARLVEPREIENTQIGIGVMIFSIALTGLLVLYQRHVIRKTGSIVIAADSLHYKGDLLINLAVIVGLLLAGYGGFTYADPLFAIGVAAYLAWGAWGIWRASTDVVMDRELPAGDQKLIEDVVMGHPKVISMHDMRTRSAGNTAFLQFHVELASDISLMAAHDISDEIEDSLREKFPGAEIIIHSDPFGIQESRDDF